MNMKRSAAKKITMAVCALSLAACIFVQFVQAKPAQAAQMTRKQYIKNQRYNKNALPAGWKYEPGYTLWRASRNMPLNFHTYKRYRSDKKWHKAMRGRFPDGMMLNLADWTMEELALFLQNQAQE